MGKYHTYAGTLGSRVLAAVLAASLAMGSLGQSVQASTLSDAKNKKSEAQEQLDDVNQNINEIEQQKGGVQNELDVVDTQLVNLLADMEVLKGELDSKNEELKQTNGDLKEAKAEEQNQYDAMKKRICYMYQNQDSSMMEAIIGSKSMSEMLNRVEYVSNVYNYDRDLLQNYQDAVDKVKKLKKKVESDQAELEEMQAEYEEQQTQLEEVKTQKEGEISNFDSALQQAKEKAVQYKKTIEEQNQVIREEEERIAAEEAAKKAAEEAARKAAEEEARRAAEAQRAAQANASASSGGTSNTTANVNSTENPSYTTNVSGNAVVQYACQFIGNPYVWGGTSLTNGADCSGFVMSVYANFGISLPHSSAALRSCGREVGYANAQPGDLICYSGHVAIYMGNGQIVHAKCKAEGITTGTATYREIVAVRRVL